jgi:neutral ceramidase
MATLRAGAAGVVMTPPVGVELEGYGARTDASTAVHDDLYVHALVLDDGSTRAAIVSVDVIGLDRWMVQRIRSAAAEHAGLSPDHVMLLATHTHGGPRGLITLRTSADEALIAVTERHIVGAIRLAASRLRPARIYLGHGRVEGVAQNRRFPDGPTDPSLHALRIDADDGEPIAALVRYTCHPTVMNFDNLQITADYPGVVYRVVKSALGTAAPVLFANGACGDINPARVAAVFDEVQRIGTIVGAEAARVLAEVGVADRLVAADNLLWSERIGIENRVGYQIEHPRLRAQCQMVPMALRSFDDEAQIQARIAEGRERIAALGLSDDQTQRIRRGEVAPGEISPSVLAERRAITARLSYDSASLAALRRYQYVRKASSGDSWEVEIQALSLAPGVALVGVPGELMVELGDRIRDGSSLPDCLVCGYANDYVGYIVTPESAEQGGYESGMTIFAPQAGQKLADAAARLAAEVGNAV